MALALCHLELELELIQTHMTQNSSLWVEVGALVVRKRSKFAEVVWAGAGVAWRLCVCVVFEAFLGCLASLALWVCISSSPSSLVKRLPFVAF
jgi:hypothetical protein